jgi:hypothetical protein
VLKETYLGTTILMGVGMDCGGAVECVICAVETTVDLAVLAKVKTTMQFQFGGHPPGMDNWTTAGRNTDEAS